METCTACHELFGDGQMCVNCGAWPRESDVDRTIRQLEEEVRDQEVRIDELQKEQAALKAAAVERVEVLVQGDQDQPATAGVWINGKPAAQHPGITVDVEVTDPGPDFHGRSVYDDYTESVAQFGYSEAFAGEVVAARTDVSTLHPWID